MQIPQGIPLEELIKTPLKLCSYCLEAKETTLKQIDNQNSVQTKDICLQCITVLNNNGFIVI